MLHAELPITPVDSPSKLGISSERVEVSHNYILRRTASDACSVINQNYLIIESVVQDRRPAKETVAPSPLSINRSSTTTFTSTKRKAGGREVKGRSLFLRGGGSSMHETI